MIATEHIKRLEQIFESVSKDWEKYFSKWDIKYFFGIDDMHILLQLFDKNEHVLIRATLEDFHHLPVILMVSREFADKVLVLGELP